MPASDVLLKGQITQECQKATGITLKVETINANDMHSRITSAIQSGTGPDIITAIGNWPQLYGESLADASDLAEEIGKDRAAITRSPSAFWRKSHPWLPSALG